MPKVGLHVEVFVNAPRLIALALSLLGMLALSGCTKWTDVSAPAAVGASETFVITATETFPDQLSLSSEGGNFGLVYSVVMPSDWTEPATGTYAGNWGGTDFSVAATRVGAPPVSDLPGFIDIIQDPNEPLGEEELAVATALDCHLSPPEPPSGSKLVWYQVLPAPPLDIAVNDMGTLSLEIISGPAGTPGTITFQHAMYIDFSGIDDEEIPEDIPAICFWAPDEDAVSLEDLENIVDRISVQIAGVGGVPIPILGGGMLALLAALMVLIGIRAGRRRESRH
jgi:hypothetical protein